MKILIVVDGHLHKPAGAENQAILLATSLSKRGHEVVLLGPRFELSEPLEERLNFVLVQKIAYPRIRILGALILIAKFMSLLMGRYGSYDAVHVHMAKNLAAVAGFLRPIARWTLTVKISGAWEFDGGILDPALRRKWLTRIRNRFVRNADAMQSISAYTRDRLIEAGYRRERIQMIPNAVHLPDMALLSASRSRPTSGEKGCVVTFVGRLVPVKGLDVLLRAWALLPRDLGAHLVLVGDGPERQSLERQTVELGIADTVTFAGHKSNVAPYLYASDIYVQPSRQEGMPNSVLQAMACGLPIIATAVSGNADLVSPSQNGLLVLSEDCAALRNALQELLSDRDMRLRMGRASREVAGRSYGLENVLDQLEKIYTGLRYQG